MGSEGMTLRTLQARVPVEVHHSPIIPSDQKGFLRVPVDSIHMSAVNARWEYSLNRPAKFAGERSPFFISEFGSTA